MLVTDHDAPEKLVNAMLQLITDAPRLTEMAANMTRFAKPDAVNQIVNVALKLLCHPRESGDPVPNRETQGGDPDTRNPKPDTQ